MSKKPTSLARRLTFEHVYPHWDLDTGMGAPGATCPLCGAETWRRHADEKVAGELGFCAACGFLGDPVQWTARIKHQTIRETIRQLDAAGLPLGNPGRSLRSATAAYIRHYLRFQQTARRLWTASLRDLPLHEPEALCRLQRELWQRFWQSQRRVELIGASHATDFENTFHPGSVRPRLRLNRNERRSLRRGSAGHSRIFHGPDWHDLVVIRFEDAPGRIAGFYCVRDVAHREWQDALFYPISNAPGNHPIREAGLAMLSTAMGPTDSRFENKVFVIHNYPGYAVRLQLTWLNYCGFEPLPIVASYSDPHAASDAAYQWVGDRELVFWSPGPKNRESCFIQACRRQARYSELPLRYAADCSPDQVLQRVDDHAVAWDTALRRKLLSLPVEQAATLLCEIRLDPAAHNRLLDGFEPSQLATLQASPVADAFRRRSCHRGQSLIARSDGWFDDRTGRSVLNIGLSVDEIREYSEYRREYHVRVQSPQHGEYRIDVSGADVERSGLIRSVVKGLPDAWRDSVQFDRRLCPRDLAIACDFQNPPVRRLAGAVGNRAGNRLHFRRFSFGFHGKMDVEVDPLIPLDAPAAEFEPPAELSPTATYQLSKRGRESRLFWATLACIAHNVVSPLVVGTPRLIGLVGAGAQAVGQEAALLLGCREFRRAQVRATTCLRQLQEFVAPHRWPTLLSAKTAAKLLGNDQTRDHLDPGLNLIVPLADDEAIGLSAEAWTLIRSKEHFGDLAYLRPHAAAALTAYLYSFFKRSSLSIYLEGSSYVRLLLHDMAAWFARQGGVAETVLRACHVLGFQPGNYEEYAVDSGDWGSRVVRSTYDRKRRRFRSYLKT